ncbi:MAG: hypothetical protein K2Q12_09690 [Rickettsiales bacterium]|nr:hypothetical protein [Rickettsiales bacterium]
MLGWMFGRGEKKVKNSSAQMGDIVTQAAQFLTEALFAQRALMEEAEALPAVAKDAWSLGYVAGFTEAVATMRQIDSEENGFVVHHAVFTDIFGAEEGPLLFATFMNLQSKDDEAVLMGMTMGGEDMFAWLNGDVETPMRWADYVNKN